MALKFFARLALIVFITSALLPGMAAGQMAPQAAWNGVLRNAGGAPIASATVKLSSGSLKAEGKTGSDGRFLLAMLPTGNYHLSVATKAGTAEYAPPVVLTASAPEALLTLSGRGELTVAAVQSKEQAATGGEELSSQAVSELPLNKRDFSSLLLLAAGTMTDTNGATNFTAQFAINGQRGVEATFAMDGADISDPEMGGATFSNFNVDAVEGIDSSSGWMPAEIGRGAAGFTNIHTRSGASGFHGSFFEFVRNSAFDARNYFDHADACVSGPHSALPAQRIRLHQWRTCLHSACVRRPQADVLLHAVPGFSPGARHDAGDAGALSGATAAGGKQLCRPRDVYPDKIVDTLAVPVDPAIAAILARYPLPNLPTGSFGLNTYATASKVVTNADQFSIRIDHNFTAKDQVLCPVQLQQPDGADDKSRSDSD